MKKMFKKAIACTMALALAASVTVTAFAATYSNEKLKLIHSSSTFALRKADDTKLLFGSTGTSHTYVSIDGTVDSFNGSLSNESTDGNYIYTSSKINYDAKRILRIIPNSITGEYDTLEVKMDVTNTSDETHNIGVRIMLDTMLGKNDDAPFRVAGVGAVTTRTQFDGNIPVSYQAFDNLQNPNVISTGSFATGSIKPDVVQFNNWGTSDKNVLIPTVEENYDIGDSCVNAIWNERALAPGATLTAIVYYGLGQIDVTTGSDLTLGATKIDGEFTVNEEGTGYNPVSLTTYISNSGIVDLTNAEVSLTLPQGVSVENGQASKNFGTLNVGAEEQSTWTLTAAPSSSERTVEVIINAKSDQTGEVTPITYTYVIPAIEGITEPVTTTVPVTTTQATEPSSSVESTEGTTVDTTAETTGGTTSAATVPGTTASAGSSTSETANRQAIQTGAVIPAVVVLMVLASACAAIYFKRRKSE